MKLWLEFWSSIGALKTMLNNSNNTYRADQTSIHKKFTSAILDCSLNSLPYTFSIIFIQLSIPSKPNVVDAMVQVPMDWCFVLFFLSTQEPFIEITTRSRTLCQFTTRVTGLSNAIPRIRPSSRWPASTDTIPSGRERGWRWERKGCVPESPTDCRRRLRRHNR